MSTEKNSDWPAHLVLGAMIMATALVVTGWLVSNGLKDLRTGDRTVMVRGLAEQDAKANLAIWPIRFVATGNNLAETQGKIESDLEKVRQFLSAAGFPEENLSLQRLEVTDRLAQGYGQNNIRERYMIAQTVNVRTDNVDQVQAQSRRLGELVKQGVVLQDWRGPVYLFTQLNDIKPDMIAKATANAREAAEQFAQDSGATLGGIKQASQGYFSIQPRDNTGGTDEKSEIHKRVRVVTSVTYALDD